MASLFATNSNDGLASPEDFPLLVSRRHCEPAKQSTNGFGASNGIASLRSQ
jgi:hypothetical protein